MADRRTLKSRGQKPFFIRSTILIALCVISFGCFGAVVIGNQVSRPQKRVPAFVNALSDFEFVGSGDYRNQLLIPPHGMEKKQLPLRFEKEKAYVFHHVSIDNQHLVYVLRDKLKSNGCKILEFVDKGPGRYIGGLAFRIRFEDERYKGFIFNTLDDQIVNSLSSSQPLSLDDYVLVIEQGDDFELQP